MSGSSARAMGFSPHRLDEKRPPALAGPSTWGCPVFTSDRFFIRDSFGRFVMSDLQQEALPTFGELFINGDGVDLVWNPESDELELIYAHGDQEVTIASMIDVDGRSYKPAEIDWSLLRATVLPAGIKPYGSTSELFEWTRELFKSHGFSDDMAFSATLFVFWTWFPEAFAFAPCLSIAGPRAESFLLLQLLECVVRRPLRVGEINRTVLCSVPPGWYPTILIDHSSDSRKSRDLFVISSQCGSYLPHKGEFVDVSYAKAVYVGPFSVPDDLGTGTIRIDVAPIRGRLQILNADRQECISEEMQPRFLAYRLANHRAVSESEFDLPDYSYGIRNLAHALASCVVDAPEIHARIEQMIRAQKEQARADHLHDGRCAVIEAMLSLCHHTREGGKIYVGEIAENAEKISKSRGERAALEARQVGAVVRSLGIRAKRNSHGFSIVVIENVRRQIHERARDFEVAPLDEGESPCSLCAELLAAPGTTNADDPGTEKGE